MSDPVTPVVTVGIIGSGNAAWTLAGNLTLYHYSVEQVISRNKKTADELADAFGIPSVSSSVGDVFPDLDLIFICTPDSVIAEVAAELKPHAGKHTVVCHMSGTTPISALSPFAENAAVMWPMQTLSRGRMTELRDVPVFIEGIGGALGLIRNCAFSLSDRVVFLQSKDRLKMHLAAVFAGNFPTFLWSVAQHFADKLVPDPIRVFEPLIRHSLDNSLKEGPTNAQTGPAKRGDETTLAAHRELLHGMDDSDHEALYELMTRMIRKKFGS